MHIIIKPTPLIFPFDAFPFTANARPLSLGRNGNFNFNNIKQIANATTVTIAIYCCVFIKLSKIEYNIFKLPN